ncbi:MAG: uracil-DNA glycosylase [Planctomycetota bacterium]
MPPAASETIARVQQHLHTLRLMGVESVPVGVRPTPHMQVEAKPDLPVSVAREPAASASGSVSEPVVDADAALDEVRARYEADAPHAAFVTNFQSIVFGEGDPNADLMFIGEAPGAEEDKTGRPFVGRAGQLLEKMIVAMGLARERVYIANVLKTRPPNNATPTSEEARACAPYLFDQIRVVRPRVIVTLGLPATRVILESTASMGQLRGRWGGLELDASDRYPAIEVAVMPTYHPAYLLRSYTPENRGKVWSDLQMAMERL